MTEESNQQNSSFKVNLNGKELTGAEAKEYVQQLIENFPKNMTNSFGDVTKMLPNMLSGGSLPFKMPNNLVSDLGLFKDRMPVLDISKDFTKMSMTMNGETLFDLDLKEITKNSINSSNNS